MLDIQRHNIEHAKEHYSPNKFKKEIQKLFSQSKPSIKKGGKLKYQRQNQTLC